MPLVPLLNNVTVVRGKPSGLLSLVSTFTVTEVEPSHDGIEATSLEQTGLRGAGIILKALLSKTFLPQLSVTVQVSTQAVIEVTTGGVKLVVAEVALENVPPQLDVHW